MLGNNILVIGEEEFVMDLQSKFWQSDFNFSGVKSTGILFERIKNTEFEIVIIQDAYSEIDSFGLCTQLKALTRHHYHILVVMDISNFDLVEEYLNSGADDFISDKFNRHEYELRLRTHLQLQKNQQEIIIANKKKAIAHAQKNTASQTVNLIDKSTKNMTIEKFSHKILQSLFCGIVVIDESNRVVWANKRAKYYLGIKNRTDINEFFNSKRFISNSRFKINNLEQTFQVKHGVRNLEIQKMKLKETTSYLHTVIKIEEI